MVGTPLLLLCLWAAEDKPTPKFPVGKETTYVTGPLDKEGYIDYEAALNDRLGKGVSPQNNANVLLWKALWPRPEGGERMPAEFFKRLGIAEPPEHGDYFIDLGAYLITKLQLDPDVRHAVYDQQWRAMQRPWAANDYAHIAAWLKANEKPLVVAIEATKLLDYFNPLISSRTAEGPGALIAARRPGVTKCRELANALAARAMLRVGDGKFDEAWQHLIACHRLGRLVARGGTLDEDIVGIAIDNRASAADLAYLERAKLTSEQIQERLKDLQGLPSLPPIADKIDLAERLTFLDSLQLIRRGGLGMMQGQAGGRAKKPSPEELIRLLMPDVGKLQNARDRTEQAHRNLYVAFALAGYHRDHGRYPATLDDLAPIYLAAIPQDLFSGKALVYCPSEKGYLLYSVGVNGIDEGGRWYEAEPPGDDPSVRMPLPELKRKK
jgi:hypothetical protein